MLTSRILSLSVQLALAAGIGAAAPAAFAQEAIPADASPGQGQSTPEQSDPEQATQMEGVMVTGSRIRQVDVETQQPVFIMDQQAIQKTGLTTVGDIISHMTVQGSPGLNKQSVQASDTGQGGSYADMRNLGANRVLVLVNGKRWITGTTGMTDLSTIPASVIDRIEVLKDGASAVYGSDAVSGVINIITRQNFEGAEAGAYFGENGNGDGATQQYDFTMGSVGDKSSIMATLSYNKQDAIWARDRNSTRYGDGPRHPYSGNYQISPRGRFRDSTGTYGLNHRGDDPLDLANYHAIDPGEVSPEDTYNPWDQKHFRIPTEQKSFYVEGRYDFTDQLSFHSTAMYTERRAKTQLGSYPLSSSTFRKSDGKLSADSIYNPVDEDVDIFINTVTMPRYDLNMNRAMHWDGALEGHFNVGEHFWDWDAGININKGSGRKTTHGNYNLQYAHQAMGPSFKDADGIHCGTPGHIIDDCIPWNVLAGVEGMTPEQYQKLFVIGQTSYGSKDTSYTANITGGLLDIPTGGELAFAAGIERREVSGYVTPDQFSQSGLSSDLASGPTRGEYSVNSVYAELSIPLLQGFTGAKRLSFDLASRYSHYSNFGSTTNNKFGFEYKPIDDLMFRGNYSEAFRAPTIDNLFGGTSETYDGYTDPCDALYGASIYGSDVHNACVSRMKQAGFANAAHFRQQYTAGGNVTSANMQSQYPFTSGPSPTLGPETAKTKTLGVVYSPRFAPGLNVSLDWYQIKIDNIISSVSANDVLEGCYQGNAKYCDQFERNASDGQVINLYRGLANRGTETVEGYDFGLKYRLPKTPIGEFQIRSETSYLSKWNSRETADSKIQTRIGWNSVWRIQSNTSLDWQMNDFGATWTIRYFSSLREPCYFGRDTECNMPDFADPYHGTYPARRVGAVAFNDLSAHWDSPWNARITAGVNNIFDRTPPIMYARPTGSPPVNPAYDIDRYWFVSYRQTF